MRSSMLADWLAQRLDRGSTVPLYRQLHRLLQEAIFSRDLGPGTRIPSSRLLAAELGIARNTVIGVYEQLNLEGYVGSAHGKGTFVADTAPAPLIDGEDGRSKSQKRIVESDVSSVSADHGLLSRRGGELIQRVGVSQRQWGAFMPGVPDVTCFPIRVWSRLQSKYWRKIRPDLLTYAPGGGLAQLRRALADYLRTSRSVVCTPGQIIITTGIHQSVDLAIRLLCDPGDLIWTEDPCYWGIRSLLQISGMKLHPISVDDEGMNPSETDLKTPPKLILVTPSHQYPLGTVMSLGRRRKLLEFARQSRCWVIEDDYDSEFRYSGRPLASLQGLDSAERVIYVGSFGKTLYPGLRVGYIVVPPSLAGSFATGSAELYREGQLLQQAVLAEFISEGYFASHIRKMRSLYAQRRQILWDAAVERYGDSFKVTGGDAGLHLVMQLDNAIDDRSVALAALERNIVVRPLSSYYAAAEPVNRGLLLGYACVADDEIGPAFNTLADVLDSVAAANRFLPMNVVGATLEA